LRKTRSRYGPKLADADPAGQIGELSGYPGADVVIETPATLRDVVLPSAWAAPGAVWFRELRTGLRARPGPEIVQKQLTIRGSWMFSVSTMMDALTVARSRAVGLDKVVTHTCGIEGAPGHKGV